MTTASVRRRRRHPLQPISAVLVAVLLLGIPFAVVVFTAGKDQAQALNPNLSLPSHWQLLQNFAAWDGRW